MKDSKGYYQTLGLQPGASITDVKKAYKKKQVELHPSGAFRRKIRESPEYLKLSQDQKEAKEKELDEEISKINEAFNVLGNETTKQAYDSGSGEYAEFPNMGDFSGFGDIFSHFAGGGRRQKKQYKVKDTITEIKLDIKDAYLGKTNKYKIKTKKICTTCSGKGAAEVTKCSQCDGQGVVFVTKRLGMMITRSEAECPGCSGKGEIPKGPICTNCKGEKLTMDTNIVELKIRPGVVNGEQYVFKGQGNQLPGYTSGDLIFTISIVPNDNFVRVDNDIISTINVDLLTALSGGVAYFEHIDGRRFAVNVQPFKNFQDAIVVFGEGFKNKGSKGDLYLKPNILINKGMDRAKLSEYVKPLISKPYGEYENVSASFGQAPQQRASQEEYEEQENGNFDTNDFFKAFRFF